MKLKKNILKFSILAGILACVLIAGSLFAFGADNADDKINIIVTVPSESVDADGTFVAEVKITNESVESFKLAGLQVELAYDSALLTPGTITHTLDTEESTALSNATADQVKFVCVKNDFTDDAGYSVLTKLFTVEFTAKSAIKNPAALFSNDSITYLMGDTTAMEITASNAVYGGDKEALALAILNTDLNLVISEGLGALIIAPTPAGDAMTKAELENAVGENATVTADNGVIGTGSKISVGEEEAAIVVKGDVDGDGVVTVFDAMMIKKANSEGAADDDKFGENDIKEFAADVDNNASAGDSDTESILDHVIGNKYIG